ncbi:uncharacterized protein HD556DRAFT_1309888 [Suillus plorans]|uniref:Uncharacterized protein n=1 Tax=Suillus plorans TaxID=116603 RepID=A0A9P7AMK2_9AGAM|nr:uncharacterized protein HD556DRAFT_1309888 [Suillus plorans]KAG1791598.1 hypothetical protein HD556DRAFT_1309888 [Suillus plorans]
MSYLARFRRQTTTTQPSPSVTLLSPTFHGGAATTPTRRNQLPPSSPLSPRQGSLIRPRTNSLETEQQEVKRLKTYAAEVCRSKGLPENSLEEFATINDIKLMMIKLMAELSCFHRKVQAAEAAKVLESLDFEVTLTPSLVSQPYDFSKKNPSVFKIPVEALQDSDAMDRLDVLMKKILTAQRGNMKQKLIASIEKCSDLSTLARSLAGNCTELTMAHWARIAFMKTTNAQPEEASTGPSLQPQTDEGGDNNIPIGTTASASHGLGEDGEDDNDNEEERTWSFSQYWEYLDKVLDELKEEARQKHVFPQARADYIKQFFTECLQQDLQIFPGGGSLAPSLDSVTVGWQRAIHEKLMW